MRTIKLLAFLMAVSIANNGFGKENSEDKTMVKPDLEDTFNFINPFTIHVDPMERLLLVNFEKDSDSVYVGFEPQVFDDEINGKGHLVIGWRTDGHVDVYHQAGLKMQPEKYDIAGKGLANLLERDMEDAHFEVTASGVQAAYSFTDLYGRQVLISINEQAKRKRKPFGLLAPMGYAAENPSAMPLVLMHDFYFVRRSHTDVAVSIGGRHHSVDKMPMPIDRTRMYFVRYSPDPLIVTLNPAFDGRLEPLHLSIGSNFTDEGTEIFVVETNAGPAIGHIIRQHQQHNFQMVFDPPFPCPSYISKGQQFEGQFKLKGHASTGEVGGIYRMENIDGEVKILLHPSEGWIPRPDRFSLRFLYRVVKVFKNWPKAYQWHASIVEKDEAFVMSSGWEKDAN